jgi:hypothetical protein
MALVFSSCRKDVYDDLSEQEARVYITRHDSTANFSSYATFRVADSVNIIQNGQLARRSFIAYDSSLVAAVRMMMTQRGYQQQAGTTVKPDIGVNVARIVNTYSGLVSYGDYWGGYGGYWDPYYWGYGGYGYYFPYAFGTYTIREGALSIDMLDLKNPNTSTNRINTIWTGLGRGTGIFNNSTISEAVQALFNQSPYIRK